MNWKQVIRMGIVGLGCLGMAACSNQSANDSTNETSSETREKYRTVITTDGEVDDMNSMIRYFYYANEMDLAGIVITSSTYHYAGDE